jgi:carboxyl-terminal processing protease
MPKRNIVWVLVGGVIVILLYAATPGIIRRDQLYNQFGPLLDVRVQIRKHYVEDIDDDVLLRGAIDGMLDGLDPYSVYFNDKEYDQFSLRTEGQFSGVGIVVTFTRGGGLTVVSPLEGSPAFKEDIRGGDRITAIDGEETTDMTLAEAVKKIQGKAGTEVALTIYRPSTETTFRKAITRGVVTIRTVRGWARDAEWNWDYVIDPENRIGYIRISDFEGQTAEQVDNALQVLYAERNMQGLIIDVRDNPGGLLPVVVEIVNRFIDEGTIVSTKGRTSAEEVFSATRDNTLPQTPLAILINGGSASASEILAGALRDHDRATLVGTTTFGKGSVQELIEINDGRGAVKLTTAYYYLPDGERIHGKGVEPDRVVELTAEEETAMMEARVRVYSPNQSGNGDATQPATDEAAPDADAPTQVDRDGEDNGDLEPSVEPRSDDSADEERTEIAIDPQLKVALELLQEQLAETDSD